MKRHKEEEWVPTQEELLEEAKITEEENIQSLEKYQRLENEKKSRRAVKKVASGPMIRYHSLRMPILGEKGVNGTQHMEISVDVPQKKTTGIGLANLLYFYENICLPSVKFHCTINI